MKFPLRSILAVLLLASFVHAEPVKIGVLTDLSGGMSHWGQQARAGAELAAREINAAGGQLELVFGDHQLKPASAVTEVRKLTDSDKIDALYVEFSPAVTAVAPILKSKQLLTVFAAASVSPTLNNPYLFKTFLDFDTGCELLARTWRERGIQKIGLFRANVEFGDICGMAVRRVFPEAVEVTYNPGEDVRTQVLSLKAHKVEALMNPSFSPDFEKTLRVLRDLNWLPPLGAQEDALTKEALQRFPEVRGHLEVFALPQVSEELKNKLFAVDAGKKEEAIVAAGLSYMHIQQLYRAVRDCPDRSGTCQQNALAREPAMPETGFQGWKNRIADFKLWIKLVE